MTRTILLLGLLGVSSLAWADDDKYCNGDLPLRRCSAIVELLDTDAQKVLANPKSCAALTWQTGRYPANPAPGNEDKLLDAKMHTGVVGPLGTVVRQYGSQQALDAKLCWTLQPIADPRARPEKLRDARSAVHLHCSDNPRELAALLPQLIDVGNVRVDPDADTLHFFGMPLILIKHAGSAYLAISEDFAVTLHKQSGAYSVVLPDGRTLSGSCNYPPQ